MDFQAPSSWGVSAYTLLLLGWAPGKTGENREKQGGQTNGWVTLYPW